ncbi:ATP-grasp domain-containing protein [Oceanobacillus polygoni]|uniref:Gamma-F420-2:alpha-L-glutamate ligase n=1 Tax=Oceanobacillus polygoni TaxID=1235259 RepID=A0A9X0YR37_9BACI|nr:ATP-grasp domain-containing protein [Oceanobacillus polygoni]MBP2077438.1 gamma-F420-2:alpha-L-glutamate ligase [Oceanobacillus polygoni]
MKTGWLIYQEKDAIQNSTYIEWFIEEARLQALSLQLVHREAMKMGVVQNKQQVLIDSEPVQLPDFAIVRTIEPLLNLHLETMGVTVFNSSSVATICNDKALTHHYIHQLGLPMVDTIYSKKELMQDIPPLDYPFIVKEVSGRGGRQVFYITNEQDWLTCRKTIQGNIIMQSTAVQLGKDLRVFVVGKEIIGSVLRKSSTDFRANFTLGGEAELYLLNGSEEKLIKKIIDHFDFGMVGIDFLIGHDGTLLFNEIEDVVGSRTLSACSDINILEAYIGHIKRCIT